MTSLPGLIFGAVLVIAGCVLIVFRRRLGTRTSKGEDIFFGRKRDLAKPDTAVTWITIAGVVAIALGVAAGVQAFS